MTNPGRGLFSLAFLVLLLLFCYKPGVVVCEGSEGDDSPTAGPVVKARAEDDVNNGTGLDGAPAPGPVGNGTEYEKKKTIAQMLDEALEQEFPEEKQDAIGKNYNETAKLEDVSLPPTEYPG
jgi:hypothetical protein